MIYEILTIVFVLIIGGAGGWFYGKWKANRKELKMQKEALNYTDSKGRDIFRIIEDSKIEEKESEIYRLENDKRRIEKTNGRKDRRTKEDGTGEPRNEELLDSRGNKEVVREREGIQIPDDTTNSNHEQTTELHRPDAL